MDLLEVERQRLLLEENLSKLKASLKHFQTLTAEYEGLTEEIQAAGDGVDLEEVGKTYAGDIVNEKEVRDLAGLPKSPRSTTQVLDLIAKRQDYVQKNIETLQRQFWDAEAKLEELDFASANRDHGTGTLPLTEIHEELDDDDNVLSSSVVQPEAVTSKLVESLRKAGLSGKDLESDAAADTDEVLDEPSDDSNTKSGAASHPPSALVTRNNYGELSAARRAESEDDTSSGRPTIRKKSVSFTADTKAPPPPERSEQEDGKRSVSFNDKVAVMPAAPPPDSRSVSFAPQVQEIPAETDEIVEPSASAGQSETSSKSSTDDMQKKLRTFMFKPGDRVGEIDSNDELAKTHFVLPQNESEEEAAIRREMLEYHLNEVGHVVAQMDLDEDDYDLDENGSTSDFPSSEYPEEDTPYTSGFSDSDRESEDEFGRSTRKAISDDYHKEMQQLQQRLIGNLGPAPTKSDVAGDDTDLDAEHVHRLVIQDSMPTSSSSTTSDTDREVKKRVSFAEAPSFAQEQDVAHKAAGMLRAENETPLAEMILERTRETGDTASSSPSAVTAHSGQKPSRFKTSQKPPAPSAAATSKHAARSPDMAPTPEGPPGQILADKLVERSSHSQDVLAPSADGSDPIMQRRELAEEYYRRRNDMIRQQGGFKAASSEDDDEEEDQGELMEERDGKLKKVSRFRAARIKG
jgi:unconventional prefoldin RPB5 interactor 1